MTPLLEVRDLTCRLGGKPILHEVSFEVQEGEFLSVLGPNGSGKTTLLRCLMGLVPFDRGRVRLAGRALSAYRRRALARLASYVPQAMGDAPEFTVHAFVLMGRYPHLSPFTSTRSEDEAAVRDALQATDTQRFADRTLPTLSGGERQAVYIAAALAQGARLLLLDEPTTFLDPLHAANIGRVLAHLNRDKGVAVVNVTHDINRAALSSHRVLALRGGRVAFHGGPAELMAAGVLESIYGKPFLYAAHPQNGRPVVVPEEAQP